MKNRSIDLALLLVTLVLLSIGVTMVLSASAPYSLNTFNDSYYFAKDQLKFALLGIAGMLIISQIDYKMYKKFSKYVFFGSVILLFMVFIPGIGVERNGATRWLKLGVTFQPSELTKIGLILFTAAVLSEKKLSDSITKKLQSLVAFSALIVLPFALPLYFQPHMSATLLMLMVYGIMIFAAGVNLKFILPLIPIGALGLLAVLGSSYRMARIQTWLNPWLDKKGDGWQIIQSIYAISSGGLFGLGLGQSIQKYMYLPEQQNDFIFAIICEEIGMFGALFIMLLFGIYIWRGLEIAKKSEDRFGTFIAIGITAMIGLQAIINMMVVTGVVPVTGMPLPFFSYGGTSLLMLLASTGILLSISKYSKK